jgi:two-component sensor histidine kinase
LRFANPSPPSGWIEDFHLQAVDHARHTTGGPAVTPPTRRSFGTGLMGSLGQQLNGQVQLVYAPAGFVYELDVPLIALTMKA